METQNTQNLAEQIADLLRANEKRSDDFLRSSLEKISQRLDRIELRIPAENLKIQIADSKLFHSSQERFHNLEESAGETDENLQMEKACPYEPTGKPCDYCAMCSSRGF